MHRQDSLRGRGADPRGGLHERWTAAEREEEQEPRAAKALLAPLLAMDRARRGARVEARAELVHPVLEAPAHGARRDPLPARDARGAEAVEVAQRHGRAVGLGQGLERFDEEALGLEALGGVRGRGRVARSSRLALAARAVRLAAGLVAREIRRHAREPGAQRGVRGAAGLQGREPGLLDDVVRRRRVAHEAARQAPDPGRVREQLVGVDLAGHAHRMERLGKCW
jgi:hypothetical protein